MPRSDLRGGAVLIEYLDFGRGLSLSKDSNSARFHLQGGGLTIAAAGIELEDQGTVTQDTNKTTGATLSTMSGVVTMNNAQLNDDAAAAHQITNTLVVAADVVLVCQASGNTASAYTLTVDGVNAGSFDVSLRNHSGGNLSEAVVYNFVVIKAS